MRATSWKMCDTHVLGRMRQGETGPKGAWWTWRRAIRAVEEREDTRCNRVRMAECHNFLGLLTERENMSGDSKGYNFGVR